jgi:heterodisulfide reductase subunit A-like polyferredoxin
MPNRIGRRAVVIGAGMAGLAAAKAVAPFFEQVTVLDRDWLPEEPAPRVGHRLAEPRKGLKTRSLWMAKATGISAQPKMESFSTPHQMLGLSSRPNACVRIWRESLPIPIIVCRDGEDQVR